MQLLRLDWNVLFTVINIIVLYFLLRKFLIGPVTAIMQKREDIIRSELSNARKKHKEAEERKKEYEDILAKAQEEAEGILVKARENARIEYDRKLEEADQKAQELLEQANQRIELEKEQTMQELQSKIAGLALLAAGRVIGENHIEENNQFMYEQFLKKAGDYHDAAGR